jgi:hypothetical protein
MFSGYKLAGLLLLAAFDFSQVSAESTKFPLGHLWYVSCSKMAPLETKEDAPPGTQIYDFESTHIAFGFSDTEYYHYDFIAGFVKSDSETVQSTHVGVDTLGPLHWSLSRVTGVLTVTNKAKGSKSKYLCEKWSPWQAF